MEGEEHLLKEAPLSLQTSLTLRELPPSAPARAGRKVVSFCLGRVRLGEVFWLDWEVRVCYSVRLSRSLGWK